MGATTGRLSNNPAMPPLDALAQMIKDGRKITFFQGAGISTGAGIPDFRSPKTGLYANLAQYNLPYPEAVFDIDYFEENPLPFYTLAHELYPGNFKPTKFHYFQKLLQDRGQINRIYTQNIDTLERIAGINDELIVEAHGSFATNHCIKCNKEMDNDTIKKHMHKEFNEDGIPRCSCGGLVKPDITFFGEGLPSKFFDLWEEDAEDVDLAIVVGTSLQVYPFASLPEEVGKDATRVLINNNRVGNFKRKLDLVIIDDVEKVIEDLVERLGWTGELKSLSQGDDKEVTELADAIAKLDVDNKPIDDKTADFKKLDDETTVKESADEKHINEKQDDKKTVDNKVLNKINSEIAKGKDAPIVTEGKNFKDDVESEKVNAKEVETPNDSTPKQTANLGAPTEKPVHDPKKNSDS